MTPEMQAIEMRPMETLGVRPHYGSVFRCIGGGCEDSCCHGMSVLIDKKTYERYQAFPEEGLGSLVAQYVSINTDSAQVPLAATTSQAGDSLYARIKPKSSGVCPFLSAERLCGVQKEYGAELLSATCSTYPRALNQVESELEVSLYLSCPQAARQVLLDAGSMGVVGDASAALRVDQVSRLVSGSGPFNKPYRYFWEIRDLVIAMIRDRARPVWQRIFLLGMLCQRLDEVRGEEQDEVVPGVLKTYGEIVSFGGLRDKLERVYGQPAVQLDVVLRLIDQRIRAGSPGERFLECFEAFQRGIGYSPESTAANDLRRYVEAEERYCRPFFERHPHILENYLQNYVFRTLFPFGREESAHSTQQSIFDEYMLLMMQYVLVYGLLVGVAGDAREGFGEDHVVKVIQSFAKAVEHSPGFLREMNSFVERRGLGNPQGMAMLLNFQAADRSLGRE
jgi:lysine-N-methylase